MRAVYRHELSTYFTSLSGYVFTAFLLLFAGIFTMAINIRSAVASFEYVMSNMSFTFLVIVPVLTMRSIAEEKHQHTDNLLYSLPLSMTDVALGKYAAMLTVFLIPVMVIGSYPLILSAYGEVNLPAAFSAVLGFFFLGAALIAIGMFISSVSERQAVAAGFCFVILLVNYFLTALSGYVSSSSSATLAALGILSIVLTLLVRIMTKNGFAALLALVLSLVLLMLSYSFFPDSFVGLLPTVLENLSLFSRYNSMTEGILDIRTLVFFVSVSGVFLFLTVQSMEKRRWSE